MNLSRFVFKKTPPFQQQSQVRVPQANTSTIISPIDSDVAKKIQNMSNKLTQLTPKIPQKETASSPPPIHPQTLHKIQHIVQKFQNEKNISAIHAPTPIKNESKKSQPKLQVA